MRVSIIGAPLALGQSKPGVGLAPAALRKAGLVEALTQLGHSVLDEGDLHFPSGTLHEAKVEIPEAEFDGPRRNLFEEGDTTTTMLSASVTHVKYAREVGESCRIISEKVAERAKAGDFCLTLGGDHSIALGSIPGILTARPDTALIWVDAHGDFNTPETSPSGNMHGMPLAMVLGYASLKLPQFAWLQNEELRKLTPDRVALVGVRSLDAGERHLLRDAGVNVYSMSEIDRYGIGQVMDRAMTAINGDGRRTFHVSFDIDSIDPSEAPGTGTLVKGGLTYREAHAILEMVAETGLLTSLDLAEVNPELDLNGQTTALGVELIASALGKSIY
ncbi:MAG: arginase [Chloroflexi bacterium]|nr:arginase [Chloroflexota bacterium]OJV94015.1 MAG: arginase [Chloroflexi bacterium 54-19]